MKHHIGLTIDAKLFREIENLRGREKRSTFIEHLIMLGLKSYKVENQSSADKTKDLLSLIDPNKSNCKL